jgi:hypothetical protein
MSARRPDVGEAGVTRLAGERAGARLTVGVVHAVDETAVLACAADASATDLIEVLAARIAVGNDAPGGGATGRVAELAGVLRICLERFDGDAVDLAGERLADVFEIAPVPGWAADAIAADLGIARSAGKGFVARGPTGRIEGQVAVLALVGGIFRFVGMWHAFDHAAAERAGAGLATELVGLAAGCALVAGRPGKRVTGRVANLAFVARFFIPGAHVGAVDDASVTWVAGVVATAFVFGTTGAVATLLGIGFAAGIAVVRGGPAEGVQLRLALQAVDRWVRHSRGYVASLDGAEAFAAGFEQAALSVRAAIAATTGAGQVLAAGGWYVYWRPAEAIELGDALLAGIVEIDRAGGNGVVFTDHAGAALAGAVFATLAFRATRAVAAFAVAVRSALVTVVERRPVEAVLVGLAGFAGVARFGIAFSNRLFSNEAVAVGAAVEGATLPVRAALATAAEAVVARAAAGVVRFRGPVLGILVVVALQAFFGRMVFIIRHFVDADEAETRAAGAVVTAFSERAALSGAALLPVAGSARATGVFQGPAIEVALGIAVLALIVRVLDARADIFDADVAMRPAFLAGGSVAAFGR